MMRRAKHEAQLRAEGIDGKARLVNSWIVGKSGGEIESIELIKFELEVMVPGESPYTLTHRQLTPFSVFSSLSKGMIIPVKVHPKKPKRILLDWEQMGTHVQVVESGNLPGSVKELLNGLVEADGKRELKDRLRELENAYKENLITLDEYKSKRADLLKNL